MKKILLAVLVVIAAVSAGVVARHKMRRQFTPYTLTSRVTDYDAKGNAIPRYEETSAQSSSGRRDVVKVKQDGSREESFTDPERGGFIARDHALIQFSRATAEEAPNVTLEKLHRSTQFVRDDEIAGIPVCVMHVQGAGSADYMEVWRAPSLDGEPVRTVLVRHAGTPEQITTVWEPIVLKRGEPDVAARVKVSADAPVETGLLDKLEKGRTKE